MYFKTETFSKFTDLLRRLIMFPDLELDIRELKHIRFWDAHGSRKLKVLISDAHYTVFVDKFWLKMQKRRCHCRYAVVKVRQN